MKKKKTVLFVMVVAVLLVLITIPGWINELPKGDSNTESQSENGDISMKKQFITDEDEFTLWNDSMRLLQEMEDVFRGFQLGECWWEGQKYYGLYNDEINLVFRDNEKAIEIAQKGKQASFTVYPKYYDLYTFEEKGTFMYRMDVNSDGEKEILILAGDFEQGIRHVDVIDVKNQTIIPVNYTAVDLANNMPQIEVVEEKYSSDGKRESIVIKGDTNEVENDYLFGFSSSITVETNGVENSYTLDLSNVNVDTLEFVVDTQNYDYVNCGEASGVDAMWLCVESVIGIKTEDNSIFEVGRITGQLVYQPETQSLELDKETVQVKWQLPKDHIDNTIEEILEWNGTSSVMYDMNNDGTEEMIILIRESGTGVRMQTLRVFDLVNRKEIPVENGWKELTGLIPQINVIEEKGYGDGIWESIVVEYQLNGTTYTETIDMCDRLTDTTQIQTDLGSEYYDVRTDGIIYTEVQLVFNSTISSDKTEAGTVICHMVYQPEKDAFVLASDTMRIEWYEPDETYVPLTS